MNLVEAREIIVSINTEGYIIGPNRDLAIEAVALAINTAIPNAGAVGLGGARYNEFYNCLDFGFKNIDIEIGLQDENHYRQVVCVIRSHIQDDYDTEKTLTNFNFETLVAGIIEMHEFNQDLLNRKKEFNNQKKEHKKKVLDVKEKIGRLDNGFNDKIDIKVNAENLYNINLVNLTEEQMTKLIETIAGIE